MLEVMIDRDTLYLRFIDSNSKCKAFTPLETVDENIKGNIPCAKAVNDKRNNFKDIFHAPFP